MPAIIRDGYTLDTYSPAFHDCDPVGFTYRPANDGECCDYLDACEKHGVKKERPRFLAAHLVEWSIKDAEITEDNLKRLNHQLAIYMVNCITGHEGPVDTRAELGNS